MTPRVEVEVSEILFQGRGRLAPEKLEHVFALFRKKYGPSQVERWYGEQRGERKSVEIELEKVLGKRPISKLSMEIST